MSSFVLDCAPEQQLPIGKGLSLRRLLLELQCCSASTMAGHGSDEDAFDVHVEFSGGLSTLFANRPSLTVPLPLPHTLRHLISLLHPMASPSEMFSSGDEDGFELRPGVLAVIGGEDWEVREPGGMECRVEKGEEVVFISTLHGG